MAVILLKRGVEETLESGLASTQSGSNVAVLPTETQGARVAIQTIFSATPQTTPVVPILASLDGVNFSPLTQFSTAAPNSPIIMSAVNGEVLVVIAQGVKAIKVGTVTLSSGTVTVKIKAN